MSVTGPFAGQCSGIIHVCDWPICRPGIVQVCMYSWPVSWCVKIQVPVFNWPVCKSVTGHDTVTQLSFWPVIVQVHAFMWPILLVCGG